MKIGLTGGASAGHVVPAVAVAAQLRRIGVEDLVFFGRNHSIEQELVKQHAIRFVSVPAAGLRRYRSWKNLAMPYTVAKGVLAASRALRRERPDVLFSKGSYVSVPVGIAAWIHRIPLAIHESDHSLGLANQILARLAQSVYLSAPADGTPPRWLARKTAITGLPLRDDLADGKPERLRTALGIESQLPVLLVFCGSSGSQRINAAVRQQLGALSARFSVVHVCGKGNLDQSLSSAPNYWQVEYLHDDMVDALHCADLVIGRAGATTLAELEALDKPAVLIPLPTSVSRGDQLANASAYARTGRCIVVNDDAALRDGRPLLEACEALWASVTNRPPTNSDREFLHRAASEIAGRLVGLANSRSRAER